MIVAGVGNFLISISKLARSGMVKTVLFLKFQEHFQCCFLPHSQSHGFLIPDLYLLLPRSIKEVLDRGKWNLVLIDGRGTLAWKTKGRAEGLQGLSGDG